MTITKPQEKHDRYLKNLLDIVTQQPSPHLQLEELRQQSLGFLQEQTIPTNKDEEWRFTDLTTLLELSVNIPDTHSTTTDLNINLREAENSRLVLVNGIYSPELSQVANLPNGLFIGNLNQGIDRGLNIFEYLGKQPGSEEIFTALNTVALQDLAVIWVDENTSIDTPIHVINITTGKIPIINQPRCLAIANQGSNITIVEEFISDRTTGDYFLNQVTEIIVNDNAQVNHIRLQSDGDRAIHIGKTTISQSRDSKYTGIAINLGAKLTRHNWDIYQNGSQTETNIDGLAIIKDQQLADTHSQVILNHPHGIVNQLHKCIIDDRAHGVFNGKVFVPQKAQLTDASQLNRNLLLSPKARIDTKPQLEITADNVKCAHGATISQLEDNEIFYLQSRGLDVPTSRTLLIKAFATEILQKIPIDSLRDRLIDNCLNQYC
jgi:Fe-S cluster assembly protein SufD